MLMFSLCLLRCCFVFSLRWYLSGVCGLTFHPASAAAISQRLSREEARDVIQSKLFPAVQFDDRMNAGRDAQGLTVGDGPIQANDPRLAYTYAEFPLESFDALIDAVGSMPPEQMIRLVDLGSGCGRLVLYAALTRGWNVYGIEIGQELHDKALSVLEKSIGFGYFQSGEKSDDDSGATLLVGDATHHRNILGEADILFAYSTAFPAAEQFNVDLGALVLKPQWSQMLATECREGCIAITTDRALDPQYGWELVDQLEVENPEVFGSIGYIHELHKIAS